MRTIGVRDLKNNLSRELKLVEKGLTVQVTDRGRVIARLVPDGPSFGSAVDRLDALVAAGMVIPPRKTGPIKSWPRLGRMRSRAGLAVQLIDEDRGP